MNRQNEILLERIENFGKGKYQLVFEQAESVWVYASEIRGMHLEEGMYLTQSQYQYICCEIVGKRAKKRALYLLQQMERTEAQLREKLFASGYPAVCVENAVAYVKQFHYVDDQRYADTFTRYSKEKLSRGQIKQKLMRKGLSKEVAESAIETEYDADESVHIRRLLEKKHYQKESADEAERRRVYNYLLRRGFCSSDILREMRT